MRCLCVAAIAIFVACSPATQAEATTAAPPDSASARPPVAPKTATPSVPSSAPSQALPTARAPIAEPVFRTSMVITALDSSHAWTVASDERGMMIAATTDAGSTWTRLDLPSDVASVREMRFVDTRVGWIIAGTPGSSGPSGCFNFAQPDCDSVIYGTTDGGLTWAAQRRSIGVSGPIFPSAFGALVAVDVQHAWVASSRPCAGADCSTEIISTTDGATWTTVATLPMRVDSLDFVDPDNGFAVALDTTLTNSPGTASILATHDAGRTWASIFTAVGQTSVAFDFVDRAQGYALTMDTTRCSMGGCAYALYATSDGGRSWRLAHGTDVVWWPRAADSSGAGFLGPPRFTSLSEGWIGVNSGAGPAVGGVLHTLDGGGTWIRSDGDRIWMGVTVAPASGSIWTAVIKYGDLNSPAIYHSTDGLTWERVLEARF
jgi:photosystem II stability/assembly factor-like uncharacterized protein